MPFKQFNKPLPLVALILAVFPVLSLLALLLGVFAARLHLGHWPSYNNPDPKQIASGLPHLVIQLCLMLVPVSVFSAIALALVGRSRSKQFPFWTILMATAVSVALLIAYGRIDPGGFVNWFMD